MDFSLAPTDAELDRLAHFLVGSDEDPYELPLLSTADGLMTAVAIGTEAIPEPEWFEAIFGPGTGLFRDAAQRSEMQDIARRRMAEIRRTLASDPPAYSPILDPDIDGSPIGEIWAEGFVLGIEMRADAWMRRLREPAMVSVVMPILELGDPELMGRLDPRSKKRRRRERDEACRMLDAYAVAAYRLVRGTLEEVKEAWSGLPGAEPGLPVASKVGRNEPCPCGSGKKYKRCCGAAA